MKDGVRKKKKKAGEKQKEGSNYPKAREKENGKE